MTRKIGKAFVAGAGIGGVRAALDLAETGYHVTLIDRAPHIGGILSRLDHQFPSNHCGMCKMLPSVNRDSASQFCLRRGLFHENIDVLLGSEILSIEGDPGNFQVTVREPVQLIDPQLCIGCGQCEAVCPVEVPDPFNAGMTSRKAVSLPTPHSLPNAFVIDPSVCTWCGECVKVCPTGAIHAGEGPREGFRILVVDDELVMRDSLKEWLGEEGFAVDMAASGAEALEMLTANTYQLMLTDIKMPGMDGVEVLEKAREIFPDLAVVMMTAYATVETAVEAMKTGALDYLMKPFDPADLIPKIHRIYQDFVASRGRVIEAGAIILSLGTDYYDPSQGKNTFGYGQFPNVITSLEFERIISNSGPAPLHFTLPSRPDRPVRKIAWLQCVGSRNLQVEADFCSSICCMIAIKEALLAKEKYGPETETAIFYMDMRTCGKSFQRYRDSAEHDHGVRFIRSRAHSVLAASDGAGLVIRYMDDSGAAGEEVFDLAVLSVGQRPVAGISELAEKTGLLLNSAGFPQTGPFSLTRSNRDGLFLGGAFAGLKDISDSVIVSSAAALDASRIIHAAGGGLAPADEATAFQDISREPIRILVVVCMCGSDTVPETDRKSIARNLRKDPAVERVLFQERICTAEGWAAMLNEIQQIRCNRILVASCASCVHGVMRTELSRTVLLRPELIALTDIRREIAAKESGAGGDTDETIMDAIQRAIRLGITELRAVSPYPARTVPIRQTALVVGGGIGGMTAALAVADHGFHVDLVEQSGRLGGNLCWLDHTIEGEPVAPLLDDTLKKVEKHPLIATHMQTTVASAHGEAGHFISVLESESGEIETISHGTVILATGGREAETESYEYGTHTAIVTQMGLERLLAENSSTLNELRTVTVILCVDSREEPRNYCSRVCCGSALKQIFALRKMNPELSAYVLYRDMMTCGFQESYLTQARREGVMFIPYELSKKPAVSIPESGEAGPLFVRAHDPVLGADVEIETDLIALATGVEPVLPEPLAEAYGASLDEDGFFKEAESKWRPVESLKEGVFACGLAHSPRSIPETVAQAQAAAQRALRILVRKNLPSGKITAVVRESLCILCERCVDACPYGARSVDLDESRILVNPLMCQGCGACASICPNDASVVEGFLPGRMISAIDAALA